jgi:outer membrane protein assembly factor BamD
MNRLKKLLALCTFALLLTGCASSTKEIPDRPIADLYAIAKQKLQQQDYRGAITQLEGLDNRYPYGPYAQQIQLDLLYAYYQASEWALAQTMSERFMRLNSTHPQMDYVLYMRGLVALALDDNPLQRLCRIDRIDRDNSNMQQAFQDFKTLVIHYPSSPYAASAWQRLTALKHSLARHELAIATYYYQREAYVAVANRVVQMLQQFPDTSATRQALPLLRQAYQQLQRRSAAAQIEQLIQANTKNQAVPATPCKWSRKS